MVKFRPLYRRALTESYHSGKLSKRDYDILLDAYKNPRRYNSKGERIDLIAESEKCARKHTKKVDWPAIFKWLKENWMTILKLILSLLPLFLMVEPNQPQD
jgi:hypothetical protein